MQPLRYWSSGRLSEYSKSWSVSCMFIRTDIHPCQSTSVHALIIKRVQMLFHFILIALITIKTSFRKKQDECVKKIFLRSKILCHRSKQSSCFLCLNRSSGIGMVIAIVDFSRNTVANWEELTRRKSVISECTVTIRLGQGKLGLPYGIYLTCFARSENFDPHHPVVMVG